MSQETEKSLWAEFRALINKNERETAAIVSAVFVGGLALILLLAGQIEGGAFVSMLGLSFVIGLSIALWGGFSELNVLGASLKLRELTFDAKKAINGLEEGRVNLYRMLLLMSMRHPGGISNNYGDGRVKDYLTTIKIIQKEGVFNALSGEIYRHCQDLITSQVSSLSGYIHPETGFNFEGVEAKDMAVVFEEWCRGNGKKHLTDGTVMMVRLELDRLRELIEIRQTIADDIVLSLRRNG
ncbi:hypothetical protein J4377_09695 [Halomonas sp. XH26]|uniref:hypothetical protein n=1 Tax=Halomonas sp. XH26 TaxID=2557993 RepID=UPI00209CB929|nr:hypothetical protein [Halomonas sp. XH26]UTA78261.1 hypothetical protein J4377_09695 [Halomonas sp. XH26]